MLKTRDKFRHTNRKGNLNTHKQFFNTTFLDTFSHYIDFKLLIKRRPIQQEHIYIYFESITLKGPTPPLLI